MKTKLLLFVLTLFYLPCIAQSVVASAGQSAVNNTMQASATVGEAIIGSSSTSDFFANQGFQQPLQSDLSTSIYTPKGQLVEVILSPNPVIEKVKLSFGSELKNIQLMIYTNSGILVNSYRYLDARSVIEQNVMDLKSGTYYINMVDDKGHLLGSIPLIKI